MPNLKEKTYILLVRTQPTSLWKDNATDLSFEDSANQICASLHLISYRLLGQCLQGKYGGDEVVLGDSFGIGESTFPSSIPIGILSALANLPSQTHALNLYFLPSKAHSGRCLTCSLVHCNGLPELNRVFSPVRPICRWWRFPGRCW